MRNGGQVWYRTRSSGGGRGFDNIDRLVVDEAQNATDEQIAAVSPTLFANPNPQLNAMGTAGLLNVSRWWWSMRRRALSADPGAFGYIGHTAENVYLADDGSVVQEPVDVQDRTLWAAANPAIASGRGGGMGFLEEQLQRMGPASFAQEHLGVWCPAPLDADAGVFWQVWSETEWQACASTDTGSGWLDGPVALAVERSPVGPEVSIVAAGDCRDGGAGVALVAVGRGTSWAVDKLAELVGNKDRPISRIVMDPKSPSGSMIDRIRDAGIDVTEIATADYVRATGDFSDAILDRQVRWRDPEIAEAAKHAASRRVGDAWLLDRRTGVDVSLLTAAVLARWGHLLGSEAAPEFAAVWT
jgi:hypothetical protein